MTGTGELKKLIPTCESIISLCSGAQADKYVKSGDEIQFGRYSVEVRQTPGHTNGKYLIKCIKKLDSVWIEWIRLTCIQHK